MTKEELLKKREKEVLELAKEIAIEEYGEDIDEDTIYEIAYHLYRDMYDNE